MRGKHSILHHYCLNFVHVIFAAGILPSSYHLCHRYDFSYSSIYVRLIKDNCVHHHIRMTVPIIIYLHTHAHTHTHTHNKHTRTYPNNRNHHSNISSHTHLHARPHVRTSARTHARIRTHPNNQNHHSIVATS